MYPGGQVHPYNRNGDSRSFAGTGPPVTNQQWSNSGDGQVHPHNLNGDSGPSGRAGPHVTSQQRPATGDRQVHPQNQNGDPRPFDRANSSVTGQQRTASGESQIHPYNHYTGESVLQSHNRNDAPRVYIDARSSITDQPRSTGGRQVHTNNQTGDPRPLDGARSYETNLQRPATGGIQVSTGNTSNALEDTILIQDSMDEEHDETSVPLCREGAPIVYSHTKNDLRPDQETSLSPRNNTESTAPHSSAETAGVDPAVASAVKRKDSFFLCSGRASHLTWRKKRRNF